MCRVHRFSILRHPFAHRKPGSCILLYCQVLAAFVLSSADAFTCKDKSCSVIMFTVTGKRHTGQSIKQVWHFIYLIGLSQQYRLFKIYIIDLRQMNMSTLKLNNFFLKGFLLSDGPSLNHCRPGLGAMGSPWPLMGPLGKSWPSVNCTGVSVRVRVFLQQYQKIYRLFWRYRRE